MSTPLGLVTRASKPSAVARAFILILLIVLHFLPVNTPWQNSSNLPIAYAQGGQSDVTIYLEITGIRSIHDCDDWIGGPNHRVRLQFAGNYYFGGRPDGPLIRPATPINGILSFEFELFEVDGFPFIDWTTCDISSGDSDAKLNFDLNVLTGQISGEVTGRRGEEITSRGDRGDDRGEIKFILDYALPTQGNGLRVKCFHSPLWPQSTDQPITIRAEALEEKENNPTTKQFLSELAIVFNGERILATDAEKQSGIMERTLTSSEGAGGFQYSCDAAFQNQIFASSGPGRKVAIGIQPTRRGVPSNVQPVGITVSSASAIDILFIAEEHAYTSAQVLQFQADVERIINEGYFTTDVFLRNQDVLNFWIALEPRDITVDDYGGCLTNEDFYAWRRWYETYSFAEGSATVHREQCKDFGGLRAMTIGVNSSIPVGKSALYATAQGVFGLATENFDPVLSYYFESDPFPNIYKSREACVTDSANLGRTAQDCKFLDDVQPEQTNWYTSEPVVNDIMNDYGDLQRADIRRIQWLFDRCRAARCHR